MSLFRACYDYSNTLYNQLISHHDFKKNIEKTIFEITEFSGKTVADIGAGSGRISSIISSKSKEIHCIDKSNHMLNSAKSNLLNNTTCTFNFHIGSTFDLPLSSNYVDIVIEGWSLYYCLEKTTNWNIIIDEMLRITKSNGYLIIIESLGAGCKEPNCTSDMLNSFYRFLDQKGFMHQWQRTDYKFKDCLDAALYANAFFTEELAIKCLKTNSNIFPECTGFWWIQK